MLKNPKVAGQKPFAVSREHEDADTHFCIVPYGLEDDYDKAGTPLTRLCILLDAEGGGNWKKWLRLANRSPISRRQPRSRICSGVTGGMNRENLPYP